MEALLEEIGFLFPIFGCSKTVSIVLKRHGILPFRGSIKGFFPTKVILLYPLIQGLLNKEIYLGQRFSKLTESLKRDSNVLFCLKQFGTNRCFSCCLHIFLKRFPVLILLKKSASLLDMVEVLVGMAPYFPLLVLPLAFLLLC